MREYSPSVVTMIRRRMTGDTRRRARESMSATTARARVDSVAVRSTTRSRVGSGTSSARLSRVSRPRAGAGDARDDDARDDDDGEDDAVVDSAATSASVNSALGDVISSPLFYVTFGVAGGVVLVRALGENASFLLSAAPIVALTVISKTEFGESLMANIEAQRPALEREKARKERERAEARAKSPYYGEDRVKFLGDFFEYEYPKHLDGRLCGDAGFDPLGLASDDETGDKMARYRELELLHARWAMLGVVGTAVPELLDRSGVAELGEPVWWKVGAAKMNSDIALDYLGLGGFHIAGGSGIAIIAACQLVLMGGPEYARYVGIDSLEPVGVYLPGDKDYPGGAPFDPFKLADDAEEFEKQKVMEIKHGRLAMIAFLGCAIQALATGEGPVENVASVLGK